MPEERPISLIDHTDVLLVRAEVAERGPYGSDPPAGGGRVAEVMPGDRVRMAPFVAGPDGVVDPDVLDPRWFACKQAPCLLVDLDGAPPCDVPLPLPPPVACELGRGGAIEFELGAVTELEVLLAQRLSIVMLSGTPEGPDTDTCVRRLGNIAYETASLRDCVTYVRQLNPGPLWRIAFLLAGDPSLPWLPVQLSDLPTELTNYEPDTLPELAGFIAWVPVAGGGQKFVEVPPGGAVTVKADDVIDLEVVSPGLPQVYPQISGYGPGEVSVAELVESRGARWFSTSGAPFAYEGTPGRASWIAPHDPGRVEVFVVYGDERSDEGAWFTIEVEPR